MLAVTLFQCAALAGSAAAAFANEKFLVSAFAACVGLGSTLFCPTLQALLPSLARTCEELIAPNATEHSEFPNATGNALEDLKGWLTEMRAAFPDLNVSIDDLIVAAVNQAAHKVREQTAQEAGKMASGLGLPPGMGLPGLEQ